jgi:hypothetical protein
MNLGQSIYMEQIYENTCIRVNNATRKCINQAYTILIPNPQKEVVYGVIISDDVRIMFHRDAAPS